MDKDIARAESFKQLEQEGCDLDRDVDDRKRRYQETSEAISNEDACALVKRFRDLYLNNSLDEDVSFNKRIGNVPSLAGECLTLREGVGPGGVLTTLIRLNIAGSPPEHPETWNLTTTECPGWYLIKFAIPGMLVSTFGASFGTWLCQWLGWRRENFVREYLSFDRFTLPDIATSNDIYLRLVDGDDSAIKNSRPEPGAIPVVLAPNEDTIAQCIEKAASSADDWDALVRTAAMLREHRQPFGDALTDWLIEAAGRKTKRPKGTTTAKRPKELRNFAIREAIKALERCGMTAMTDEREPGSACVVCAKVFELKPGTIRNIWNKRDADPHVIRL